MVESRIAMICFGDILNAQNGYALRCKMLAESLLDPGLRELDVYQFGEETSHREAEGMNVITVEVSHEKEKAKNQSSTIGFNIYKELKFPIEGFVKLLKYRKKFKEYDEIYIEGCLLINAFLLSKVFRKKIVMDTHCVNKAVALGIRKKNFFIGSVRVLLWHVIEKSLLSFSDEVIVLSEVDRRFIKKHYKISDKKIRFIPHKVNKASLESSDIVNALRKKYIKDYKNIAFFLGDLGAIQNKDSVKFIINHLAPHVPRTHFLVAGNNPENLISQQNITFLGFVDSLSAFIMASDVCIAPMSIGSGIKTKVLDYLEHSRPVLATKVAAEGIPPTELLKVIELKDFSKYIKDL